MKPSSRQIGGDHYRNFAIQPAEFIHRNGIDWLSGNIIKYACRHAAKHGADDVRKIIHYAELILEWQYGAMAGSSSSPPGDHETDEEGIGGGADDAAGDTSSASTDLHSVSPGLYVDMPVFTRPDCDDISPSDVD